MQLNRSVTELAFCRIRLLDVSIVGFWRFGGAERDFEWVPLRTGRVFCAVAWAVSEGSNRLFSSLRVVVIWTVREKIEYYVLCNERYRTVV